MKQHLDDTDKINHPFRVEDDYFDQLTKNIQRRVAKPSKSVVRLKWSYAIAPILLMMLTIAIWQANLKDSPSSSEQIIAQVSTEDILYYLEQTDLTEQDLLSLAPEGTLHELYDIEHIDLQEENLEELLDSFDLNELDI